MMRLPKVIRPAFLLYLALMVAAAVVAWRMFSASGEDRPVIIVSEGSVKFDDAPRGSAPHGQFEAVPGKPATSVRHSHRVPAKSLSVEVLNAGNGCSTGVTPVVGAITIGYKTSSQNATVTISLDPGPGSAGQVLLDSSLREFDISARTTAVIPSSPDDPVTITDVNYNDGLARTCAPANSNFKVNVIPVKK